MAENSDMTNSSVRQLAPGQLKNIREMFESKSDSPEQIGISEKGINHSRPQLTRPRPLSTVSIKSDTRKSKEQENNRTRPPRPATTLFKQSPLSMPSTAARKVKEGEPAPRNLKPVRKKSRAKSDVFESSEAVVKAVNMMNNQGKVTPVPRERSPRASSHTRNASLGTIELKLKSTTDESVSDIVSKRTKMFESADLSKQTEQKQSNIVLRPTPPIRPRSRPTSGSSDGDPELPKTVNSPSVTYCSPWDIGKSVLTSPPPPPKKPPRTGAHDDYLRVKVNPESEKLKEDEIVIRPNILYESIEDIQNEKKKSEEKEKNIPKEKPGPVYRKIVRIKTDQDDETSSRKEEDVVEDHENRPKKPTRPPPPRTRPMSIASDNFTDFSFEKQAKDPKQKPIIPKKPTSPNGDPSVSSPFYEDMKIKHVDLDDIKHWDLPGTPVRRNQMRRSVSAECVADKKDDMLGEAVYVDPVQFRDDIYVDSGGYAVPYKHRNLQQAKSLEPGQQFCKYQYLPTPLNFRRRCLNSKCRPISEAVKSKFGNLKKLLKTESPSKSKQEDVKSSKKKLESVRLKISLAFSVVRAMQQKTEEGSLDEETPEQPSENDSLVDVSEIVKRKEHCNLVRKRTMKSVRGSRRYQDSTKYSQMFDYGLIVGLEEKEEQVGYKPKILYKFPDMADSNVSVPEFCFPDAAEFDVKSASPAAPSESYSFVLTNVEGGRIYGYCRRLVPLETPAGLSEVICIISPVDAFSMYNELLDDIEQRRQHSLYHAQELMAAAFGRPMPDPGKVVQIRSLDEHGEMRTQFLTRPEDNRIDNANREFLLSRLGVDKLLKIFACILLERSVLLCAKNLSTLSQTIHALASLLYPFHWQHVYIPVLPESMLEVCCSPTPYLIGILSSHVQRVQELPLSDIVIFDLNKKQMIRSNGDEGTLIPKLIQKAMKTALNMCKNDSDASSAKNLMVSEVFLRFFVEAIAHFAEHINNQQDGKKVFVKESFIQGAPTEGIQQFLEWFTETQMFEVFITQQVEKSKPSKGSNTMGKTRHDFRKESFIQGAPTEGIQQFLEWFTETQMFEVFITQQVEKSKPSKGSNTMVFRYDVTCLVNVSPVFRYDVTCLVNVFPVFRYDVTCLVNVFPVFRYDVTWLVDVSPVLRYDVTCLVDVSPVFRYDVTWLVDVSPVFQYDVTCLVDVSPVLRYDVTWLVDVSPVFGMMLPGWWMSPQYNGMMLPGWWMSPQYYGMMLPGW
ncbi:suppression of tumorigenicity 5 protein-like [Pecten maximus]|uniref:suppression of tumorigenicity 5 protein-like n=1 Tax=Pecten maximus TaxID=6579 RepID=UPI00145890C2|nr:suppression of tumorigenicity 5 protein-like [Pecten maximus]